MSKQISDHLARPGPVPWDGKCLVCDKPVRLHDGIIKKVFKKIVGK